VTATVSSAAQARAAQLCREGREYYRHWDIEGAILAFESAIELDETKADYFLYLAQAYTRVSNYDAMRQALGRFIYLETDQTLIDRFEALFGSALDEVETSFTQVMTQHHVPLQVTGAAIYMWLEFRVAMGRQPIDVDGRKSKEWAAALDYVVRKVNIHDSSIQQIAQWYGVSPEAVKQRAATLIETLDIMPCDYRYFRGPQNPLDKLVEAAILLETLEERFSKE